MADQPRNPSTVQVADVVAALTARKVTVATSESLTGGLLAAELTAVPGASAVVRGGLVVYGTDAKSLVGGVPQDLLHRCGPVSAPVAEALARGTREAFGSTYGLSVTGVAGPGPQPGQEEVPVGTVFIGLAGPDGVTVVRLVLAGGRVDVRSGATAAAVALLWETAARAG